MNHDKFIVYWTEIGKPPLEIYSSDTHLWYPIGWEPNFDNVQDVRIKGDRQWKLRRRWIESDRTLPLEFKNSLIQWRPFNASDFFNWNEFELREAPSKDDWIEWGGGKCPVDADVKVKCRFRSGEETSISPAGAWNWAHEDGDIVAYKVVESSQEEQKAEIEHIAKNAPSVASALAASAMAAVNLGALSVQIGGDHYKDCKIQPVEFIEANGLGFLEGCCVKRLARHDKPTGKGKQDIEKAIHELQLLLQLRYGDENK